jgi:signal transduction histidine kinase
MPRRLKLLFRQIVWILRRGRFIPWTATICGVALSAMMWLALNANEDTLIRETTAEVATTIKRETEKLVAEQLAALGRMAKRWDSRGGTPKNEWLSDANNFLADQSGYESIAVLGPDLKERWRLPTLGKDEQADPVLPLESQVRRQLAEAKGNRQVAKLDVGNTPDENYFLVAVLPLRRAGKPDGHIAARISFAPILTDTVREVVSGSYAVEAFYNTQLVFHRNTHLLQLPEPWREQVYVDLPGISIRLHITPTAGAIERIRSGLPGIGLFVGIAVSGLIGYTIYIYQRATRRRQRQAAAQRELSRVLEHLQKANQAKSDFLARMSHELRTPLNAIIGFSQVIKDEHFGKLENDRYLDYAHYIFDSGKHLLDLISDVLDLSKIEAGEHELHREPIKLAEAIEEEARLFANEATHKKIELRHIVEENLPPLNADRRALKQMLANLLSNAIKFTPENGAITVYANATYETIRIDVTDTGVGMTEREVEVALAPFQQVANPHTADDLGTGLGLPIVKSLMDLHGGRLSIISSPRSGTRVTLAFPR